MKWLYKQLAKDLLQNKAFAILLFVMAVCTSLFYFDFHFSIDKNLQSLRQQTLLTENQQHYHNALQSNIILARTFLIVMVGVCAFSFAIFFYRYFRANRRQIGCLKALGFCDNNLAGFFVVVAAGIAIPAVLVGIGIAYFTSTAFLNANMQSYSVTGLVKGLAGKTVLIGVLTPSLVYGATAAICYQAVRGKEAGSLLGASNEARGPSLFLPLATAIAKRVPSKQKFPLRIALRKPLAIIILYGAVLTFLVFFIIANSLIPSSQVVYNTQTAGHHYAFQTEYADIRQATEQSADPLRTIKTGVVIEQLNGKGAAHVTVIGARENRNLYDYQDQLGNSLPLPAEGEIYINPALVEMYGYRIGDRVSIRLDGKRKEFTVAAVLFNANAGSVYLPYSQLLEWAGLPSGSYNYALSMLQLDDGGTVLSPQEKEAALQRGFVSNNNSSTLNHVVGFVAGAVLIFLALLLAFQDSTRDILVLHLLGYRPGAINALLLNVYRPMISVLFVASLWPGVAIAKAVLRSLSIQTNDYMPFTTSIWVFLAAFVFVELIYLAVQTLFRKSIKRVIAREEIAQFTTSM